MKSRLLLNNVQLDLVIKRLCYQLIENHNDFSNAAIIGIQPRGIYLAERIRKSLIKNDQIHSLRYGILDMTFYRDDYRQRELIAPVDTKIDFIVEGVNVILVDDVLFTGRTIRAAIDALLDFGRPAKVELLTLVDRRLSRQLPVASDYTGLVIDTLNSQKVKVQWKENGGGDEVWLMNQEE